VLRTARHIDRHPTNAGYRGRVRRRFVPHLW
jgi:hypothetical protein